jgi:gas vesicle protein
MGVIGKTLKFTLGMVLGIGLGAIAASLLAPQNGRVTREQIQARIDQLLEAAHTAQQQREKELLEYWERQISKAEGKGNTKSS